MQEVSRQLTTDEELFCTRYELETLSGIVNDGRLERWLPGFCSEHTNKEHESRYNWVKDFVKDRTVLDIACGTGFGSYKLINEGGAVKVTGFDVDDKTIRYASLRNKHPRLFFEVNDAETFAASNSYDIIVSFETIEHLHKPQSFLKNINAALAGDGQCFISTPIASVDENKNPDNVFHQTEWGFRKFQELVKDFLIVKDIFLQVGSTRDIKTGFFPKLLQKAGLKHADHADESERFNLRKWDPKQLKEDLIGTEWTGYQILQCSKKPNA